MLEISDVTALLYSEEILDEFFSEKELQRYSTFKLEKRRNEWLSGRLCAKLAAGRILDISTQHKYREIEVINAPGGRPSLQVQELDKTSKFDISISHSGNFAVALVANDYCGVDIQKTNETLQRVKERFCSSSDEKTLIQFFNVTAGPSELNLLWSAKEAIRKALSHQKVPDFLDLNLSRIEMNSEGLYAFELSYTGQIVRVLCGPYTDYCLALCIHKG